MSKKYAKQEKYEKDNVIRVNIKLNKKTDADIIAALDLSPGKKTGSIKKMLRKGLNESCLHCGSSEASYCENCFQKLINDNVRMQMLK